MPADEDDAMDEDEPPSPGAVAAAAKKASPPGILKPTSDAAEAPARAVTSAGAAVGTKVPAAPSASDAYASLMADDAGEVAEDVAPATIADGSLPLDVDDSLPFYLLDAHEDINSPGKVFLFGRVPVDAAQANGETVSACAVVHNMQRCVFFVPRPEAFADPENEISDLEDAAARAARAAAAAAGDEALAAAAKKAKGALLRCLQGRAAEVKGEVREMLLARGIETFSMKPVKRSYCFEREDIPRGAQYVLKVRYPALAAPLPRGYARRVFRVRAGHADRRARAPDGEVARDGPLVARAQRGRLRALRVAGVLVHARGERRWRAQSRARARARRRRAATRRG